MTTTTLNTPTPAGPPTSDEHTSSPGFPNARGEAVFLTAETYTLTAQRTVHVQTFSPSFELPWLGSQAWYGLFVELIAL